MLEADDNKMYIEKYENLWYSNGIQEKSRFLINIVETPRVFSLHS